MVAVLAVEIQTLQRTGGYSAGGATVGDFILAPIPSAFFPSKPETWRNRLLVDTFNEPCSAGGGCPDFSVVGTFYQDFWYPGAILGMSLFGIAAAGAWRRFIANRDPEAAMLVAAVIVFWPVIIRAGWLPSFTWFLYFIVPSIVGIRYVATRARTAGTVRS